MAVNRAEFLVFSKTDPETTGILFWDDPGRVVPGTDGTCQLTGEDRFQITPLPVLPAVSSTGSGTIRYPIGSVLTDFCGRIDLGSRKKFIYCGIT